MENQVKENVAKNWAVASVILCVVMGSLFVTEGWLVEHQLASDSQVNIETVATEQQG